MLCPGVEAGHPDEDEVFELTLTDTNMIYEVEDEELVPREDYWGAIPKIEILDHNKVLLHFHNYFLISLSLEKA